MDAQYLITWEMQTLRYTPDPRPTELESAFQQLFWVIHMHIKV